MRKNIIKNMLSNQSGLTLIEVMVAVLLLSIIALTFFNVFITAFDNSIAAQENTSLTYGAQAVMEELRAYDYAGLIEKNEDQTGNTALDVNADGIIDCYMHFKVQPYGTIANLDKNPGAFVHLIYLVDHVLVVDGDGNTLYTNTKNYNTITLKVNTGNTKCTLTVNGNPMVFYREATDSKVCVIGNLNYKDLGYNNNLVVTGDRGDVLVKSYGNDIILEEFTSDVTLTRFSGIQNLNSALMKVTVELYHEQSDTVPFHEMYELIEVPIGDRDTLIP